MGARRSAQASQQQSSQPAEQAPGSHRNATGRRGTAPAERVPAASDTDLGPYLTLRVTMEGAPPVIVKARPSEFKAAQMIVERGEMGLGDPPSAEVKALASAEVIEDPRA